MAAPPSVAPHALTLRQGRGKDGWLAIAALRGGCGNGGGLRHCYNRDWRLWAFWLRPGRGVRQATARVFAALL